MNKKLLILIIFIIASVFGQAEDQLIQVTPSAELPGAKGVEIHSLFPGKADHFPAGKVHQFLTLFHNGAPEYMNVTYIEAQLVLPQDNSIFVQNFTKQPYFINVPPGAEVTIDYFWRADNMIEPMKLVFMATIYYRTTYGQSSFSSVLYNRTIQISEPEEDIYAGESMFLYLLLLGTFGAGGYFFYLRSNNTKTKSKPVTTNVSDSPSTEVDESWLTGTAVGTDKKKKNSKKNK